MKLDIISVGNKMPNWVNAGFSEYHKRFSSEYKINLIEIAPLKRAKNFKLQDIIAKESELILEKIKSDQYVVLLDLNGKQLTTEQFAQKINLWKTQNLDIVFVIGGADGVANKLLQRANFILSISKFTFAHMLVRIILIEQLYRAVSFLLNHPYHRA